MKNILIVLIAAALAACGNGGDEAGENAGEAGGGLCERAGNQMDVDASCFDEWPLTVDSGVLVCENDSVVFDDGEAIFAVNREAELRGVQPITPILANADGGTSATDVEPLIEAGLRLCAQ